MNKNELLSLAKELSELDSLKERRNDVLILKRESRKFNSDFEESFLESSMSVSFNKYMEIIEGKLGDCFGDVVAQKKDIIQEAKKLLENAKEFRKSGEKMKQLFEAYKAAGRSSKEQDDDLWAEFKEIQNKFYEKKAEWFASLKEQTKAAEEKKTALVEEAKKALGIENFKEANKVFNDLMNKWKEAGFAGKNDQVLWREFSAARKEFFEKRKEFNSKIEETYKERISKKEELIKQAKLVLANSSFTKEEIKQIKDLRENWKTVGFAGRQNDDKLYQEFNGVLDKYFEALRAFK